MPGSFRVVAAALMAYGVNAAFLAFVDVGTLIRLGLHVVTLVTLSFGGSAFLAAAFGGPQKRAMLLAVFIATVVGIVSTVANDPAGATAGFLFFPVIGVIPAGLGAVAGLTVDRARSGSLLQPVQVVAMWVPFIVLLVGALFFPELLTPTLNI